MSATSPVGEIDGNAAAVAVDVAFEVDAGGDLRIGVRIAHGRRMAAFAAGIEVAGPVAEIDAEPERIFETTWSSRRLFGGDEELHHGDLLLRMLRQMLGVIAPHETGIGLRLGDRAGEHPIGKGAVRLLVG